MEKELNGYNLSRWWFDWIGETENVVTLSHTALFHYIIHTWNTCGQKKSFGLPTDYSCNKLNVNAKTYAKLIKDLAEWGVINILQESKNQYSSKVICLGNIYRTNSNTTTQSNGVTNSLTDGVSDGGILNSKNSSSNSINKRNTTISKKVKWEDSPHKNYDVFKHDWIALGEIETSTQKYKPTDFEIKHYWITAKNYGERNPKKSYVSWVVEGRRWLVNNFEKGEMPKFSSTYKAPVEVPDLFNDRAQLRSIANGERVSWAERLCKGNPDLKEILNQKFTEFGIVLNGETYELVG